MNQYISAAMLGAGSGMRTTAAPFAARWKRTGTFPVSSAFALAGELVVDKLPFTPARTNGGQLGARMTAAGFATRSLESSSAVERAAFVGIAALAACGTAYLMMRARKALVERTGIPDALVALAEDALALTLVLAATRRTDDER